MSISVGKKLFTIRQSLGLTQHALSEIIGVSEGSIWNFQNIPYQSGCNTETRRKINSFINSHQPKNDKDDWPDFDAIRQKDLQKLEAQKAKIFHSFILGKRYCIQEGNPSPYEFEFNPLNGKGCIFIYLRKEGKHHVFREERGGWIRTYTDNQLIGKYIKEVNS